MKSHAALIAFVTALLMILLLPAGTSATPVTYTYVGNAFTDFVDHTPPDGSYDTSNHVEVTLTTIDGYLPDSSSLQDISSSLSNWSFTDGRYTIDSSMTNVDYLNLDAAITSGSISQWVFLVQFNTSSPAVVTDPGSIIETRNIGTVNDRGSLWHWYPGGTSYSYDRGRVYDNPGSWTSSVIPEPTSLLLLGTGLGALGLVAYRRKRK